MSVLHNFRMNPATTVRPAPRQVSECLVHSALGVWTIGTGARVGVGNQGMILPQTTEGNPEQWLGLALSSQVRGFLLTHANGGKTATKKTPTVAIAILLFQIHIHS